MHSPALQPKRNQQVLADVVRTYIETGEPVSSRSISKLHGKALSSATIRNVMADLEEAGYLFQPHTSAGRVPTEAAYRFFVEEVAAQGTVNAEDRAWIRNELAAASTPEAVMERASHVLAALSRGLGIIVSPPLSRTQVEHLRFVLLPDGRVLVVLISTGGLTRDKLVRTERSFTQQELDHTAEFVNRNYSGWTLEAIRADLKTKLEQERERYERLASSALQLCDPKVLGGDADRQVYVEGAAQIAAAPELADQQQLQELLGAIEERSRLVALLSGCIEAPEPVHVEFGIKEMSNAGQHLAIVSAPYSYNDQAPGTLGILGPIRMHYERIITAVAFMAQLFGENLRGDDQS